MRLRKKPSGPRTHPAVLRRARLHRALLGDCFDRIHAAPCANRSSEKPCKPRSSPRSVVARRQQADNPCCGCGLAVGSGVSGGGNKAVATKGGSPRRAACRHALDAAGRERAAAGLAGVANGHWRAASPRTAHRSDNAHSPRKLARRCRRSGRWDGSPVARSPGRTGAWRGSLGTGGLRRTCPGRRLANALAAAGIRQAVQHPHPQGRTAVGAVRAGTNGGRRG